jgi:hypothetical protein
VYVNKPAEAAVHPSGLYGFSLESGTCKKVYGGGSPLVIVPSRGAISLIFLRDCVVVLDSSRARLPLLLVPPKDALDLIFLKDCGVAVGSSHARLPVLVVYLGVQVVGFS